MEDLVSGLFFQYWKIKMNIEHLLIDIKNWIMHMEENELRIFENTFDYPYRLDEERNECVARDQLLYMLYNQGLDMPGVSDLASARGHKDQSG